MMHEWSAQDWVLVLGAVFAGITSIISILKTTQTKALVKESRDVIESADAQSKVNSQKLDEVHSLTNGNLSKTQEELYAQKRKTEYLEKLMIEITARCPPGELDKAKDSLEKKEAKIGKRRKSDLKREEDVA